MASKQRHGGGRHVRTNRRTVRAFLAEWQAAVGDSMKPSTRQNYADYIRAYVEPIIGDRRLQDITVPVLNLLYRRLLTEGRVKTDRNSAMYAYWSEHRAERDGLGPDPGRARHRLRGEHPRRPRSGAAVSTRPGARRRRHRAGTQDRQERAPDAAPRVLRCGGLGVPGRPTQPSTRACPASSGACRARDRKPWTVDELTAWLRVALVRPVRRDVAARCDHRDAPLGAGRGGPGAAGPRRAHARHRGHPRRGRRLNRSSPTASPTAGVRVISLDDYTVELLRAYLAVLDEEREAFGAGLRHEPREAHALRGRPRAARRTRSPGGSTGWSTSPASGGSGCTTYATPTPRSRWTAASTPRSSATGSGTPTKGSPCRSAGTVPQATTAKRPNSSPACIRRPPRRRPGGRPMARWSQIWSQRVRNGPQDDLLRAVSTGSGGRIRTYDLWVMSPASYRAAPPRVACY